MVDDALPQNGDLVVNIRKIVLRGLIYAWKKRSYAKS